MTQHNLTELLEVAGRLLEPPAAPSICGMPVVVDESMPAGQIEFVQPTAAPTTSQQAGEVTELELFEEWIEQEAGKGALKKWPNEHGTSYENLRVCDYRTGWLAALAAFEAKKAGA